MVPEPLHRKLQIHRVRAILARVEWAFDGSVVMDKGKYYEAAIIVDNHPRLKKIHAVPEDRLYYEKKYPEIIPLMAILDACTAVWGIEFYGSIKGHKKRTRRTYIDQLITGGNK